MNYPEELKIGDLIGITAPSGGIKDDNDILRFENGINNLKKMGYKVIATPNCRTDFNGRSSSAEQRAKEFMELYENKEVKAIICQNGGDFLCEVLDLLDFDYLKTLPPKWIQGYSDVTNLNYVFTQNLDIGTIYGYNFKNYGMKDIHESIINCLRLMKKEEFIQDSYEKCEEFKRMGR